MRDWIRLVSRDRGLNAGRDEHPWAFGLRITEASLYKGANKLCE